MPWLQPWAGRIEELKKQLSEADQALSSIVQGKPDALGLKKSLKTLADAQHMYSTLKPVIGSVSKAQAMLKPVQ
eukprot:4131961-Alexandrium_andersonii.AAC.1